MYRNAVYGFALLLVVELIGFWRSYFSKLTAPDVTFEQHFHGIAMLLWVLMLIAQAWLIRTRRRGAHRALGWTSVVLAPLLVVSGLLVIHDILTRMPSPLPPFAYQAMWMGPYQVLMFGLLWALAIVNRRNMALHMRYMCATAVMFINPGLSRAFNWLHEATGVWVPTGIGPFLVPTLIAAWMVFDDYRRGRVYPPWVILLAGWLVTLYMFPNAPQLGWWVGFTDGVVGHF